MKLVLASKNPHKLTEISAILGKLGVEVVLQSELGIDLDVEETGTTFEENALLKAEAVMKKSGLPAIADDSGLMVDALGGEPGVYSARYGGLHTDDERIDYLLSNLEGVPAESRGAQFVCCITALWPDGRKIVAKGVVRGVITTERQGCDNFGYDPIFYLPEHGCTYAQMPREFKNQISHRAKALEEFVRQYNAKPKMTSKQRAELRAQANTLDTTLIVGKGGVSDELIAETEILLDSKELVKGKVLETALLSAREASDAICERTGAEGVATVGSKFVIWRKSEKVEKEKKTASKAPKTAPKKKVNPVKLGIKARKQEAKAARERRKKYYHDAAVQAAIDRRKENAK